jgi:hypothetical protein
MLSRRQVQLAAGLSAAIYFCGAQSAFGCTPAPGWPHDVRIDGAATLKTMAAAATYVDIAVVDRISEDFEFGTRAAERRRREGYQTTPAELDAQRRELKSEKLGARYHYRVIEHLKGAGSDEFSLNGQVAPPPPAGMKVAARRRDPPPGELKFLLKQFDLADSVSLSACEMPIMANPGDRVLVFRDADGHLLQQDVAYLFHGRSGRIQGPVHIPVVGERSSLVEATRKAIAARTTAKRQ